MDSRNSRQNLGQKSSAAGSPGETTLVLESGGAFVNLLIEQHLVPNVPYGHYPQIVKIVRRTCLDHGVRSTTRQSLRAALRSHFGHLRRTRRLGLPVGIEMG